MRRVVSANLGLITALLLVTGLVVGRPLLGVLQSGGTSVGAVYTDISVAPPDVLKRHDPALNPPPVVAAWDGDLAAPAPPAPIQAGALAPAPPETKKTALIVGINNARGGRPLPGSITDATNLRDALLQYGFVPENITMLLEGDATRDSILFHLDALVARTPSDGIAVFAAATHTRKRGGQNELLTYDGLRITAQELANSLGRIAARTWVALPTCYAAGYALPGIVGPNRIATFGSEADKLTFQLGEAGSDLFIHMVRRAMLERRAPGSVQEAYRFAEEELRRSAPNRMPAMSDGLQEELVLGHVPRLEEEEAAEEVWAHAPVPEVHRHHPQPAPTPTPAPRRGGVGVCGPLSVSCNPR